MMILNPHDHVQKIIAKKIGLNIRIQSSKKINKDHEFTLKAIIPFTMVLVNGHRFSSFLQIKDLDKIIFEEKQNGLMLKKDAEIKKIDKKIKEKIKEFNSGIAVSTIRWDGQDGIQVR